MSTSNHENFERHQNITWRVSVKISEEIPTADRTSGPPSCQSPQTLGRVLSNLAISLNIAIRSLVAAVLPDDLIIVIVEEAAQHTVTALSLALVSKAVGRMAESVLYRSINLRSFASVRVFAATLHTKSRRLLAGVAELTLTQPVSHKIAEFWSLVGQWCPHILRLSLYSADLAAVRPTRLQPHHLSLTFVDRFAELPTYSADEPSPGPWGQVSHLHLRNHPPDVLVPLLEAGTFTCLTHLSCYIGPQHTRTNEASYNALRLFLALPTLRVCLVVGGYPRDSLFTDRFLQGMPQGDRRLVVSMSTDIIIVGDGPYWEFAERAVAARTPR